MSSTPTSTLTKTFLADLGRHIPKDRLLVDPADCWNYGYDNSQRHHLPAAVALVRTNEEALGLVQTCLEHTVPIFPRGRGTGTTGASVPTTAGLVISFEAMRDVLSFSPSDRCITVQVGITSTEVQNIVGKKNFLWGPDPGSAAYSSLGGNLAVNAAGPRSLKYGSARENTLGLSVITGEAEFLRTGGITSKQSNGFDLTRLFIGSEGTLGLITEATLKLTPLPSEECTLALHCRSEAHAARSVETLLEKGADLLSLEFLDTASLGLIRNAVTIPEHTQTLLLMDLERHRKASYLPWLKTMEFLEIQEAETSEEQKKLWAARKALSPALRSLHSGKINEDVVVPVSKLSAFMKIVGQLREQNSFQVVCFGHAGNGNMHINFLFEKNDPSAVVEAREALKVLFSAVQDLGGLPSGEHGIGLEKKPFLMASLEPTALAYYTTLKKTFDPKNILNPSKIFAYP